MNYLNLKKTPLIHPFVLLWTLRLDGIRPMPCSRDFLNFIYRLRLHYPYLNNPVEIIQESELENMKNICEILKPFKETTLKMSADKNITISKIMIIININVKKNNNKFTMKMENMNVK